MAVLVLLAGTARARVVAADLLVHVDRSPRLLLAVGGEIVALGSHIAHILASRSLCRACLAVLAERYEGPEEE